jgi:hypothetical protein|tara:strand:- start:1336 stop:1497 length:162 start_codon:yes stop_codon:yes gene_type:complete
MHKAVGGYRFYARHECLRQNLAAKQPFGSGWRVLRAKYVFLNSLNVEQVQEFS